ncbi:histidine phosphatase family protein [Pseudomonas sp. F1_0610]|uniref:histidine phosphatase family protein n=1 Tax=Pseudomonas sp. F1_0610 TaxID=3114284 RepID=UPI0039C2EAE7
MKKIVFFRHAQSVANIGGVSQPNAEIELTAFGHQQALSLVDQNIIKPDAIFTSAFLRTQQTAAPLAKKYQLTAESLACLNEFNIFDFDLIKDLNGQQRLPLTLAYWRAADPDKKHGANAQSFNEFNQQVIAAIPSIRQLPSNSVIFGHGMWFSLFAWHVLVDSTKRFNTLQLRSFFKFQRAFPVSNLAAFELLIDSGSTAIYLRQLKLT